MGAPGGAYTDRYRGHALAHPSGLFELTATHAAGGWAAGGLASTLSVKTVTMKDAGGSRRAGRGGGRGRAGGSEAGDWMGLDDDRDGWCADSVSMAVECSADEVLSCTL